MSDKWERRGMFAVIGIAIVEFVVIVNLQTANFPWARREIEEVKRYSTEIYGVASVEETRDLLPRLVRRGGTMAFVQLVPDDSGYVKVRFTRDKQLIAAIRKYAARNGKFPEVHLIAEITETRHAMFLGNIFKFSRVPRSHVVRVDGNFEMDGVWVQWYNSRPALAVRT